MTFVFPFVREKLTGGVQDVAAVRPYAVDVIANPRESTLFEGTGLRFHELLETVARQLFIFDVVRLVLIYVSLIFKCISAA